MTNEETVCCSCGQRVPKAIVDAVLAKRTNEIATPDRVKRAAEEIDKMLAERLHAYDYVARSPAIKEIAAIISKYFPVNSDAQSLLLKIASIADIGSA